MNLEHIDNANDHCEHASNCAAEVETAHKDDVAYGDADYEIGIEEKNKQKEELYAAGYFLFQHKQYSKACRVFSVLCQLDPHDARFYRGVGACWEKQGELEKAARAYKYASMMRITDPMIQYQYAFCLVRLGRYEEADLPLQMVIANSSMDPRHKSLVSKANAILAYIERCKGEQNA